MDVKVAPGSPHTIAVVRSMEGGLAIYDDAIARPTSVPGFAMTSGKEIDSIQWSSDATHIYGEDNANTGFDFYVLSVNSSGVQVTNDYPGVFNTFNAKLHYDATTGYVYSDGGQAVNPDTGKTIGTYADASGVMCSSTQHQYGGVGCVMVPDGTLNIAYFLGQTPSQQDTPNYTIEAFNLTNFTPISSITISDVTGNPVKLIRWGANGLAFLTKKTLIPAGPNFYIQGSEVYIISGAFVTNPAIRKQGMPLMIPGMQAWAMPTRSSPGDALGSDQ